MFEYVVSVTQDINATKLHKELLLTVPDIDGVTHCPGMVKIITLSETDDTQKASIETIITDHSSFDLATAQEYAKLKTYEIYEKYLGQGFDYSAKVLSCSTDSQNKWTALVVAQSGLTFPLTLPTLSGVDTVILADVAALNTLYGSLFSHCSELHGDMSFCNGQIMAATTQAAIDIQVAAYEGGLQ